MSITTWAEFIETPDTEKEYLVAIQLAKPATSGFNPWTYYAPGVYHAPLTLEKYSYPASQASYYQFMYQGVKYGNADDLETLLIYPYPPICYFDFDAGRLYVRSGAGPAPNDGTALKLFWMFFSKTGKTPYSDPQPLYANRVISIPVITSQAQEFLFGRAIISSGALVLDNGRVPDCDYKGFLEEEFYQYLWANRKTVIYVGGADLPRSEYKQIWGGVISSVEKSEKQLTIMLKDVQSLLDVDVTAATYTTAAYPHLEQGAEGKIIPQVFGACRNVRPTQVDTTNWTFQICNHDVYAIDEVREDGIPITAGAISKYPQWGLFILSSYAGGVITCDVRGRKNNDGSLMQLYGDIFLYLIATVAGMTSDQYDAAAISAMNTSMPYALGIYIDSQQKVRDVLSLMDNSVLAWHGCNRSGLLTAEPWALPDPAEVDKKTFTSANIMEPRERISSANLAAEVRIGYQKNWCVQPDTATKAGANRQNWAHDFLWCSLANTAAKYVHAATETKKIETLLVYDTDAAAVAALIQELTSSPWAIIEFTSKLKPLDTELGDTIEVVRDRTIFPDGDNNFKIFDYREDHNRSRITISAFRPL